jgi:hypothetical protein
MNAILILEIIFVLLWFFEIINGNLALWILIGLSIVVIIIYLVKPKKKDNAGQYDGSNVIK